MSDAISLKNQYGKILASSREVAEKFGKRNPDVNRAIGNLIVQNCTVKDMFIISSYTSSRGREEIEYLMDRDGFSLLVMGFNGKKALEWKLKYIEAFNSMEKMLRELSEPQDSYLIEDPAARARRWAEEYEEKQRIEQENMKLLEVNDQLQTENDEMRPKAEYHDEVLNKKDLITITVIAKDLGFASGAGLNKILIENKILYRTATGILVPYAKYNWLIEEGYADFASYPDANTRLHLKWTEKGRQWIIDNYYSNWKK